MTPHVGERADCPRPAPKKAGARFVSLAENAAERCSMARRAPRNSHATLSGSLGAEEVGRRFR
jgi:hypothetical protein